MRRLLFALILAPIAMTNAQGSAKTSDWRSLFDGKTMSGWRGYQKPEPVGWQAVDGALTRVGPGGDIVSDGIFGDFELALEWKISPKGNSGVMYRVGDGKEYTFHTGPEYQILDDAGHADGKSRLTSAGALYGLYPSPEGHLKSVGEWNTVRIVAKGAHIEHWLNGTKVVEYELWSPDWEGRVKKSKFVQWPDYGRVKTGRIALQDHGDWVAYRNIRVRELK